MNTEFKLSEDNGQTIYLNADELQSAINKFTDSDGITERCKALSKGHWLQLTNQIQVERIN